MEEIYRLGCGTKKNSNKEEMNPNMFIIFVRQSEQPLIQVGHSVDAFVYLLLYIRLGHLKRVFRCTLEAAEKRLDDVYRYEYNYIRYQHQIE